MLTPANGICNDQYLLVTGTIWPLGFKRLCGINPDQHFYVHLNDAGNFEHIDSTYNVIYANIKGTIFTYQYYTMQKISHWCS